MIYLIYFYNRPTKISNGDKTVAITLCSSGTSGQSKAVALTHVQILNRLTYFM